MGTISLDEFINVQTVYQDLVSYRKALDIGLLIGSIPQSGGDDIWSDETRIKTYSSIEDMIQDGFLSTDRLYKAAALFFSQENHPQRLMIGKIGKVTEANTPDEGEILLSDALTHNAESEVGKYIWENTSSTPSSWEVGVAESATYDSFFIVANTVTRAETPIETITACRLKNEDWYMCAYCAPISAQQITSVSEYIETARPASLFVYSVSDSNVLTSGNDGIFNTLKGLGYKRSIGVYCTDDAVLDVSPALLALWLYRMGVTPLKDFLAGYISLTGVKTQTALSDSFTAVQMNIIDNSNGNVYVNTGSYYDILVKGKTASGVFVDEIMMGDKFENDCQTALADLLFSGAVIPQTAAGGSMLVSAVNKVCARYAAAGYISPGTWTLDTFPGLSKGTVLPAGYYVTVDSFDAQSEEERQNRIAPPIYACVKLGGKCMKFTLTNIINR